MAPLGRLTAALGVAHNENTLALANINFDFSLIRVEAPPEFQLLGANLSDRRRQEAETGTPHRTARKLGALFEGVLPRTPELARAYGQRVSEISQSHRHNPRGNGSDGPFAAHIGADGTAIWAAATSGASAIPILMLACMLARIWSGPEATSLWVELVARRRHEIETTCTDNEASLFAAQQDISRSQLADWDASARAWLRTADEARTLQQTQLMLVINNLQLPVSNNMSVYQSVIESSRFALLSMEKLLKGQPQRVQSGAFLLGLSAWHLYPDMVVHGTVTQKVDQNDDLFPIGSMVTLGLESSMEIGEGIYWSLPLAHLRYYGDPIQSSRSTVHDASRISIDQLVYVALGALFSGWVERSHETKKALSWFSDLSECFNRAATSMDGNTQTVKGNCTIRNLLQGSGWLKLLLATAASFVSLRERDKDIVGKLLALGHRRFRSFLAEAKHRPPSYFGLREPSILFPLLKNDDERINTLRRFAEKSELDGTKVVIRYKHLSSPDVTVQQLGTDGEEKKSAKVQGCNQVEPDNGHVSAYEYASAFPYTQRPTTRNDSRLGIQKLRHKRWVATGWREDYVQDLGMNDPRLSSGDKAKELLKVIKSFEEERKSGKKHIKDTIKDKPRGLLRLLKINKYAACQCTDGCKSECVCKDFSDGCIHECSCHNQGYTCDVNRTLPNRMIALRKRMSAIHAVGEDCAEEHPRSFVDHYRQPSSIRKLEDQRYDEIRDQYRNTWESKSVDGIWHLQGAPWDTNDDSGRTGPVSLRCIYGDPETAALYSIRCSSSDISVKNEVSLEEIRILLGTNAINVTQVSEYLASLQKGPYASCISSLKALASATKIYKNLSGATVALSVASKPLYRSLWAPRFSSRTEEASLKTSQPLRPKHLRTWNSNPWLCELNLASTFACIAMFESGTYDIDPETLDHVFAMSSGNSLFVAGPLLNDPSEWSKEIQVERVVGNIGRAGIAMLIPPQDPRIRKRQLENWELVSHAPFDGQCADSFQNTTHHLSFTQYTMPCNIGTHGAQDTEAFFIESLISVHDREKWVADLDVLGMFRNPKFGKCDDHWEGCVHTPGMLPQEELLTIDNWEELLDRERVPVVVRAHRNPMARLATAVVSVKQGYRTILVTEQVCWPCVTQVPEKKVTFIQ